MNLPNNPMPAHRLATPTNPDALAALLKCAGDSLRLQILRVLSSNAFGALELSDIFAMRQNAMSHHLKLLANSGLVNSRREGTHIFYRRANVQSGCGAFPALCAAIVGAADAIALPDDIQQRLEAIENNRAAASQEFFRANAAKFRKQQDLIASYPQYGEAVLAIIDSHGSHLNKLALEVGPGEGELLPGLQQRFARVVALDNSAEMLARAEEYARERALNGIEFVLADTQAAEQAALRADVITLNMVLHHTPAPAAIIADLAKRLAPGGLLLVTELCQHDQDWARTACGDLWLGFEPEELSLWAQNAGLQEAGSEFLALKNGFSIQLRQFRRAGQNGAPPQTRVH